MCGCWDTRKRWRWLKEAIDAANCISSRGTTESAESLFLGPGAVITNGASREVLATPGAT